MHRRSVGGRVAPTGTTSAGPSEAPPNQDNPKVEAKGKESGAAANTFECNVCFDIPRDPVVTPCGHLYCWSCLYRWMRQRQESPQCPVCKAGVDQKSVIPIYGRGRTDKDDPREKPVVDDEQLPPRPSGQRGQPVSAPQGIHGTSSFGMPPGAFNGVNAYGGMDSNLTLATFGNFPSLFGMQIAYPRVNEPTREQPQLTPEQETREQVAKVFLFLALFIIVILMLF